MTIILSNMKRFKKNFTGIFLGKFIVKWILKIPLHFAYVATLPCEWKFFKHWWIFRKVTSKNVVVSCTFFLFHNYGHESLAHFFGATCICIHTTRTNVLYRSQPRYFSRKLIDISLQSVILHVNLSQPRQGFRYPSGSRGKASLVMRSGVKAFCCISGTMTDIEEHATFDFVVVSSAWAMSTIN